MKQKQKVWSLAWRLGVCFVLLAWVFHAIFLAEGKLYWQQHGLNWESLSKWEQWRVAWSHGPPELWRTLRLVEPWALAVSQFWMGITILLGVWRWRMVLKVHGLDLPFRRAASISMVAQCFNSFFLGSTGGDLLKAYYTARETHHKKTEAVVTVFVDRLIGLFSMLLFACLMMLPNLFLLRHHERLAALSGLIVAMMLACGLLVVVSFWGGVSRGLPQARAWLRGIPKGDLLEKSIDACRVFGREPGFLLRTVGISMLLNAVCVLQVGVLAQGLGLRISPEVMFLVVPMIICVSALPITISGLGVRESLFVWILAVPQFNIEHTKALSLSLLAYAVFLTWSLIGGVVYLTVRHSQHLDEVARENEG